MDGLKCQCSFNSDHDRIGDPQQESDSQVRPETLRPLAARASGHERQPMETTLSQELRRRFILQLESNIKQDYLDRAMAGEYGFHMSDQVSSKLLDKKERKKEQNRLAQRNYRKNQKNRMRALEALETAMSQQSLPIINSLATPTSPSHMSLAPPAGSMIGNPAPSLCEEDFLDCIKFDVDPMISPPSSSTTPVIQPVQTSLLRAVCNGNEPMVRLLLDRGADISKQDADGNTALHLAAAANKDGGKGMVRLLLERSANPNAQDFLGQTALFAAVQNGNEEVVKLLLDASVGVNLKDTMGNVALHFAVEDSAESMVLLLLTRGADIDA